MPEYHNCPATTIAQEITTQRQQHQEIKQTIKDLEDSSGISELKTQLKTINSTIRDLEQQLLDAHNT